MSNITFIARKLSELSGRQIHDMLFLRSVTFVEEQQCVYTDPDPSDRDAIHILGAIDGQLVAYGRIYRESTEQWHIGRIIVKKSARGQGLSTRVLQECLRILQREKAKHIELSAQLYLEGFYKNQGFLPEGNLYLEDGIPHLKMVYRSSFK